MFLQSQEDIDALLEEVAILQAIHHPHVMHLLAFYDDSKYYSLVTEIVDGGELFDRIVEKQHYNEHIAREFVKIFLMTLDFLHSNGIVHRGLFPYLLLCTFRVCMHELCLHFDRPLLMPTWISLQT